MSAVREIYAEYSLKDNASATIVKNNKLLDESAEKLSKTEKEVKKHGEAHAEGAGHMQVAHGAMDALGVSFILGAEAIAEVTAKLIEFTQESIHLAAVAEHNETILKNLSGEGFEPLMKSIEGVKEATDGAFNTSQLSAAAVKMHEMTVSSEFLNKNLGNIAKLSIAYDTGTPEALLNTAQRLGNLMETGNLRSVKNLGVLYESLKPYKAQLQNMTEQNRERLLSEILQKRSGKLQEDYNRSSQDYLIQLNRIHASWESVQENFGKLFLDSKALQYLKKVLDYFGDTEKGVERIKSVLIAWAGPFGIAVAMFRLIKDDIDAFFSGDRDSLLEHIFGGDFAQTLTKVFEFFDKIKTKIEDFFSLHAPEWLKHFATIAESTLGFGGSTPEGKHNASGGTFGPGQMLTVGEHGSEQIFTGGQSGSVIPHGDVGRGGGMSLNISFGSIPVVVNGPGDLAAHVTEKMRAQIDEWANTSWRAMMGIEAA